MLTDTEPTEQMNKYIYIRAVQDGISDDMPASVMDRIKDKEVVTCCHGVLLNLSKEVCLYTIL